jgi:hypothetical protein
MDTRARQLSFELEALSHSRRVHSSFSETPIAHSARPKMASVFHPEGSFISPTHFAIKISHNGQAYLIQGTYHLRMERSFSDGSVYAAFVDRVNVERIYLYRDGSYVFVPISKAVQDRLSHRVLEILSDPQFNPNLSKRASA